MLRKAVMYKCHLGCAPFLEILQNLSECQILWSLCLAVFHAFTLKLLIQTSLSVAPELLVHMKNVQISGKRAYPWKYSKIF